MNDTFAKGRFVAMETGNCLLRVFIGEGARFVEVLPNPALRSSDHGCCWIDEDGIQILLDALKPAEASK